MNLPPVAYVFNEGDPNGWIDAQAQPGGLRLELNCIDRNHPENGKRVELTWS